VGNGGGVFPLSLEGEGWVRVNHPTFARVARALRRASTEAESVLWNRLRNRRLCGRHFRRQHPVGTHVVDFICIEARLVVEVDGAQHLEQAVISSDADRTRYLNPVGLNVLRFNNREVLLETNAVVEAIMEALSPSP
jgi:very-short-patch-repair endonuclease